MKLEIEERYLRCKCGKYYIKYDDYDIDCCDTCNAKDIEEHLKYLQSRGKSYIDIGRIHLKYYVLNGISNYKLVDMPKYGMVLISTLPNNY